LIITNKHISILLQGCRDGDRSSQKQLYEMLIGFAMKTCYLYGAESAEEMAQEGFIKLFKHIDQFDESRLDNLLVCLKGWFKKILINACIDHLRKNVMHKKIRFLHAESEFVADASCNGFDSLSYKDILNAIGELSPAYRSVFNLFAVEGMSHEEIAIQLGISIGASKSNLSKAREKLRKILTRRAARATTNENLPVNQFGLTF
jgi:RNA polymerase sigma factor (sigma-70 family)